MTEITFNKNDTTTARDYKSGLWDKKDIEMAVRIIKDTDIVMDIGANVGVFSVNVASKRKCRIYAFEPIPETYHQLTINLRANNISTVKTYNSGMSVFNCKEKIHTTKDWSAKSSLRDIYNGEKHDIVTCKFMRLDDFCEGNSIVPNFIKCDVEGAELLVFYGGIETIFRHKPIIMVEIYRPWHKIFGYNSLSLIKLLDLFGYNWYVVEDGFFVPVLSRKNEQENNYWAIRKETNPKELYDKK